jgi:hypothetical protein
MQISNLSQIDDCTAEGRLLQVAINKLSQLTEQEPEEVMTALLSERGEESKSYGEDYINIDFNPSGNKRVSTVKRLAAAMIDNLGAAGYGGEPTSDFAACQLYSVYNHILTAQMHAVKLIVEKLK